MPRLPQHDDARDRSARLLLPPAAVLVACVLLSAGAHLPVYGALGALADYWGGRIEPPAARPLEVTFRGPSAPSETPSEVEAPPSPAEPTASSPEPARPDRPEARAPREEAAEVALAAPEAEPEPEPEPAAAAPAETPPPPDEERRAVVQRSEDPSVEAPDDARFLAEENNDVEEETVAEVTSTVTDDPDPSPSAPEASESADAVGDGSEDLVADARDVEGSPDRHVTPEEARERPPNVEADPSRTRTPTTGAGADEAGRDRTAEAGSPSRGDDGGAAAHEGGTLVPTREVLVSDGFGTYVVRVPEGTLGSGGGEAGGARSEGRGSGAGGRGRLAGREGDEGGGRERRGERAGRSLGLSWSDFESVYGEEELEREREARLEERRSHDRGAGRRREWTAFRAAMENYIAEVRPGNQTALDAAASPFAVFLNQMHARIHRHFADSYIASLGPDAPEGQNDPSLRTTLEVAVNPDGTLFRVGIVRTSGNTLFDFAAFHSMYGAQPFPEPPSAILSGDGRAWLHWTFDRGERLCGTWNAEPFLLENGPGVDRDPRHDEGPAPSDPEAPPAPGAPPRRDEAVPT